MNKLTYMADRGAFGPLTRPVLAAQELVVKGREAMDDLEYFAGRPGAAWVGKPVKPAREDEYSPLQLPLHSTLLGEEMEGLIRRLRASVDPTSGWPAVYQNHFSLPTPAEIIPLTKAFTSMQTYYSFDDRQIAAAAFALNAFVYEGLSGRVLLDDVKMKILLADGLIYLPSWHLAQGSALDDYTNFQRAYYSELEEHLIWMHDFMRRSARAEVRDVIERLQLGQLASRFRNADYLRSQIIDMELKDPPDDPKEKAEFEKRLLTKKRAVREYERPDEYRQRGDGRGRLY